MCGRLNHRAAAALVAGAAAVALLLGLAAPASAAGERQGEAVVADPRERSKELMSGDNDTLFTLRLPSGAACPGDSANDDWRVQSFLIPASVEPAGMRYRLSGPDGTLDDDRWALYATGQPFTQQLTMKNDEPGLPGLIDLLPPFNFPYRAENLPPGRYRVGVACTPMPAWTVATYWDTQIDVSEVAGGEGALTWTVVADPNAQLDAARSESGRRSWLVPLLFVAGVVIAAGVVVQRRSRSVVSAEKKDQ